MEKIILYLLSILPFYESRYTIPLLVAVYGHAFLDFVLITLLNYLVFPFGILFLSKLESGVPLRNKKIRTIFISIKNRAFKITKKYKEFTYLSLFFLTFLPFPGSGVYTATIVTYFLGLDYKKAGLLIFFALLLSNTLIYLTSIGIVSILTFGT